MPPAHSLSENYRGILYMIAAGTGFITSDTLVKLASEELSIPQIIVLRSAMALPVVLLLCWRQAPLRKLFELSDRYLWLRTVGEIGANATFLTALAHLDLANISAITQLTPLAVTAAAAIFLGEKVGIRRWSAIVIGFLAVLLVIRPGTESFSGWSILALACVGFVVLRDLSSRAMALTVHPLTVTAVSLIALIPLGLVMPPFEPWTVPTARALAYCLGSALAFSASFVLVVHAMRHGEISVVSPFRYLVLIWAILIQIVVFAVWPDSLTLIGSAILVATGLYTLYRERTVRGPGAPVGARVPVPPPS